MYLAHNNNVLLKNDLHTRPKLVFAFGWSTRLELGMQKSAFQVRAP